MGNSKAIIIPVAYLKYWQMRGKKIREFDVEISKKILLSPIFEDIPNEKGGK